MLGVPVNVYETINKQLGHIVNGKIVLDNTNIPAVRQSLTSILRQCGCNIPIDLIFKVVSVEDTVIVQMKV